MMVKRNQQMYLHTALNVPLPMRVDGERVLQSIESKVDWNFVRAVNVPTDGLAPPPTEELIDDLIDDLIPVDDLMEVPAPETVVMPVDRILLLITVIPLKLMAGDNILMGVMDESAGGSSLSNPRSASPDSS